MNGGRQTHWSIQKLLFSCSLKNLLILTLTISGLTYESALINTILLASIVCHANLIMEQFSYFSVFTYIIRVKRGEYGGSGKMQVSQINEEKREATFPTGFIQLCANMNFHVQLYRGLLTFHYCGCRFLLHLFVLL